MLSVEHLFLLILALILFSIQPFIDFPELLYVFEDELGVCDDIILCACRLV